MWLLRAWEGQGAMAKWIQLEPPLVLIIPLFVHPVLFAFLFLHPYPPPPTPVDKESACNAGDLGSIPGSGRSPEKEMATHSSILAREIPWTAELGRLQSMGLQESHTT